MRLALHELRRNPGRFFVATVTISLIAILLFFLGALLDGLLQLSTGAYQAQRGQLVVMSQDAKGVLGASRLDSQIRGDVTEALRVTGEPTVSVGGYGETALGARIEGGDERDLVSVRLRGYELAPAGLPESAPARGEVWADPDLVTNIEVGDVLLLGPGRSEVTVVGMLDQRDTPSLGGLWGSMETWRTVLGSARPGATVSEDLSQALIVDVGSQDADLVAQTADAIEAGVPGMQAFTLDEAGDALPGVAAQRTTFSQIIGITTAIALVVIALFFALLTAERVGLYGVLKAIGARSSMLFAGVATQAIAIALIASLAGLAMILGARFGIPPGTLPFTVTASRIAGSVGLLLASAVIGSAFSLRSVLRIDPAKAIGGN